MQYPVIFLKKTNEENDQWICIPDLELLIKINQSNNLNLDVVATTATMIKNHLRRLQANKQTINYPKTYSYYRDNFNNLLAKDYTLSEITVDFTIQKRCTEKLSIGAGYSSRVFSALVNGLLAILSILLSDNDDSSNASPGALTYGIFGAIVGFFMVMLIYIKSGATGYLASFGRNIDNFFLKTCTKTSYTPPSDAYHTDEQAACLISTHAILNDETNSTHHIGVPHNYVKIPNTQLLCSETKFVDIKKLIHFLHPQILPVDKIRIFFFLASFLLSSFDGTTVGISTYQLTKGLMDNAIKKGLISANEFYFFIAKLYSVCMGFSTGLYELGFCFSSTGYLTKCRKRGNEEKKDDDFESLPVLRS